MRVRRSDVAANLREAGRTFDLAVIGGGAIGAGIALDAASRGLEVALVERGEFGCGTSSRSSKLIHGGLRYVGLGQWALVREALRERSLLLELAPAIVEPLDFVVPVHGWRERAVFGLGLSVYHRLAGQGAAEHGRRLTPAAARELVPGLAASGLRGAFRYTDARFDDARLLQVVLARARAAGALTLNYAAAAALRRNRAGRIEGLVIDDLAHGERFTMSARVVINAAGPFGDAVRALDPDADGVHLAPSQGAHVVVPGRFLGGAAAVVFPRTPDGRVMFAVPWHGHTLLGTTDTAVRDPCAAPRPLAREVDQILEAARRFLDPAPTRADVTSTFAGLRPLAGAPSSAPTSRRSREHCIDVSRSGLISVSGGKWTTYRLIAEQVVDKALEIAGLPALPSRTRSLTLAPRPADAARYCAYGAAAAMVAAIAEGDPALDAPLHPELPCTGAELVFAARAAMAEHVADALAYHTRALFVNAAAAAAVAPRAASLMARELGRDRAWEERETAAVRAAAASFSL